MAGPCGPLTCVRAASTTPPRCASTPRSSPALATWIAENSPALGDLGYEGESGTITVAFKKPKDSELTDDQKDHNKAHNATRAVGERGNSLLKTTFKALRNVSLCPWKSAPSSQQRSSSSTSSTTSPHDHPQRQTVTRKDSLPR
jgi:DDE superfamily endonuclease